VLRSDASIHGSSVTNYYVFAHNSPLFSRTLSFSPTVARRGCGGGKKPAKETSFMTAIQLPASAYYGPVDKY